MADSSPATNLLASEPLPEGAPKPELSDDEHVEVYGTKDARTLFIVKVTDREVSIRHHWSSSQDIEIARQVLAAIRQRHITTDKKIVLRLSGTQTALIDALGDLPVTAERMVKPVDSNITVPADVKYRHMRADEAAAFLDRVRVDFERQSGASRSDLSAEQVAEAARVSFAKVVPQGIDTPGHVFLAIEAVADSGDKVADLWVFFNEQTKESFCYDIEVMPTKRRMGYGKKTLVAWEHVVAHLGAQSLGLNVFGSNPAARGLYHGAGFVAKEAAFILEN